ncbi:glycosyl transferase family 2 [Polaribacter sp. SA4-10]|uniref:glycosyltransferase n=1 Tax=Polaribacter sp. SA4-10 TaxID=754397 RepID=UPI000B3CF302|nr:glycosyltransferase [Polaribacter sp. SA4-10]ARV07286.1 glycosyl transferase family 2 [Polaribacter sp. SA4-10]
MITASIVLYNENIETLKKTVDSFLNTPIKKKLYLIDNSPNNNLESHFINSEIEYIFVGKNSGFGKAHNFILDKINSQFHLILNPDVAFDAEVIPALIKELKANKEVAFISPKVVSPNNEYQYICRKHPTIIDLINRKINFSKKKIYNNEYRNQDLEKSFYPDFIHGCFMLFKTQDFKDLKGFDERYFLYMEDADICKKIDNMDKNKLYFPKVKITHHHQRGSSKHFNLFLYHISSAIKYFLKWNF